MPSNETRPLKLKRGSTGASIRPARVGTGKMLEDEKAKGIWHVAIGSYRSHTDFLIDRPTIKVTYREGSNKSILIGGKLQIKIGLARFISEPNKLHGPLLICDAV